MMNIPKTILLLLVMFCCKQSFGQVNLKDLTEVDGKVYTKDKVLYSGEFFLNGNTGKLRVKGAIKNGLPNGIITGYFESGKKNFELTLKDGKKDGPAREYFENGNLKSEVNKVDDKDDGKILTYYETGEKHTEANFNKGVQVGDYIEYDKQGKVTRKLEFVAGRANYGQQINDLLTEADDLAHKYKSDEAIALYTKAIAINPGIAEIYFNRGAAKGNKFDMDGAIGDYDKAIELYPDYKEAYANRGVAKINKYTSKGIIEPSAEQSASACEDFYKARDLGDGEAVADMIYVHCERNKIKSSTDTVTPKSEPLLFMDGKKTDQASLKGIDPNDMLEVEVLKSASATSSYGPEGKNGVILMTSNDFGMRAYQKVLSALSKKYADSVRVPDTFLYHINGKLLTGKKSETVGKLYHLKSDTIQSVTVSGSGDVNIITK
jgi:tetratricopeptide (TPR) repeat protein